MLIIIGEWNATLGSKAEPSVVGKFGLGVRNEAEEQLIEFCKVSCLFIANTCFK